MEAQIRRRFSNPAAQMDPNQKILLQILGGLQEVAQAVGRLEEYLTGNPIGSQTFIAAPSGDPMVFTQKPTMQAHGSEQFQPVSPGLSPGPSVKNFPEGSGGGYSGTLGEGMQLAQASTLGGSLRGSFSKDAPLMCDRIASFHSSFGGASSKGTESVEAEWLNRLGHGWPTDIPLRLGLQGHTTMDGERIIQAISQGGKLLMRENSAVLLENKPRLPVDPNSRLIARVDAVKLIVLLHDVMVTPYLVAWNVHLRGGLMGLSCLAGLYWAFDMFLNFVTGFYVKGDLIMTLPDIVRHYVRNHFMMDAILLAVDWTVIFTDAVLERREVGAFVTLIRGFRIFKLLRIHRLIRLLDKLSKMSLLASTLILAQMVKIPLALVVYNNIVSCVWGYIGRAAPTDIGERWLDGSVKMPGMESVEGEPHVKYSDLGDFNQYLVAFHWTLAQMTPGPINIVAGSSLERGFNVCVLVCGLLFGSMIVSQFSSIIMQMTLLQREQLQKLDQVRKFLMQRKIGNSLALRVQKQVTQRLSEEVPLQVHDVPAFGLLATALHDELLREVRMPHLLSHPMFALWARMDQRGSYSFCTHGLQFFFLPPPEVLFEPLGESNEAYQIISGRLAYIQEPPTAWEFTRDEVTRGSWMCEAALWSQWIHVGKAEALSASELLVVSSEALMAEFQRDHPAVHLLKHYGRSYHQRVLSAVPPYARWPTDLKVPFTDISDLLGPHVGIGMLQSEISKGTLHLNKPAEQELMEELLQEKCALTTAKDGGLQRMVAVVALKVKDREGNIFAELGKCDAKGVRKASCTLPGGKRAMNEVPQVTLKRVMEKRLPGLEQWVVLEGTDSHVETKPSPQFGMNSTYTKTLHLGSIVRPIELPGYHNKTLAEDENTLPVNLEEVTLVMDTQAGGWLMYGWLQQEDFDKLNEEEGSKALKEWFAQVSCEYAFEVNV